MPNANLSHPAVGTVLAEAVSPAGHRVTLTIECGAYPGARPFYVIARHEKKRPEVRQDQRVVPLVLGTLDRRPTSLEGRRAAAERRAFALYDAFAQDVIDAQALASWGVVDALR